MKRIGFIINSLSGGGAERVVCTLANHYAETGRAMPFILSLSGAESAFPLHADVGVDTIWSGQEKSGLGAAMRSRSAARAVAAWRARHRLHSSISFLQRANFANVLSFPDGRAAGERLVISQRNVATHDYPSTTPMGVTGRILIRRLYNRADLIVCNSPGVVDSLVEIGVRRELCRVIGNPQDIEGIRAAASSETSRLWRSNSKLRLIAVGRLIPQKGYEVLLPALARLAKTFDFECLILGRGPLQMKLERQREALGLTQHVTFYGWDDNPFSAINDADVFLLPSRWEGFGNVLLEAMALGKPIVAADCPGSPRWLLEEGRSGLLFESGRSEELYDALQPLAADMAVREDYGQRAARRAEDFSVERMAKEYRDVLLADGS